MIVVIADDLSGAAELAGAAFRHGLTAEVQTQFTPGAPSQVVCVDSEGRSGSASAAATEMRKLFREVASSGPDWIFLKFDSVLRGNIAAQLRAALEVSGRERALLITANPSRGRTIQDGDYHVDGVPLHLTSFAEDPEFPCTTSSVRELLGGDLPGIVTPDVESTVDLDAWAAAADENTLTAGSAEFFEALLRLRTSEAREPDPVAERGEVERPPGGIQSDGPVLVVCGSREAWARRTAEAARRGVHTFDILDDPMEAAAALSRDGSVLLGIGDRIEGGRTSREDLLDRLGDAVAAVCGNMPPDRLLLEGGATAVAVVRRMGWTRLTCEDGVGAGVGTLSPPAPGDPLVLIKPGSYPWPEGAW